MAEGILSSDGTQWKEKSFFGVYNHGSEPIRNSLKFVIIVPSPSHSTTLCKLFRQYLVLRFCNLLYWVLKVSFSHLHHTYRAHNLTLHSSRGYRTCKIQKRRTPSSQDFTPRFHALCEFPPAKTVAQEISMPAAIPTLSACAFECKFCTDIGT